MELDLLHRRLGHYSYADTKSILSRNLVTGAKLTLTQKLDPICEPCLAGKLNAGPFPSTGHRSEHPLDLIHSDLKEYKMHTREGWKHRITFIDDRTSFKVCYHMACKSHAFKLFKAYAENDFGQKIKGFQDDKGGEYICPMSSGTSLLQRALCIAIQPGINHNRMGQQNVLITL
jgi:hypothetical protein